MTDRQLIDDLSAVRLRLEGAIAKLRARQPLDNGSGGVSVPELELADRIVRLCRASAADEDDRKELTRLYDAGTETWHEARVRWVAERLREWRDNDLRGA